MTGKLKDLTINRDGTQNVTVTVNADFREEFDRLADKDIDIEIKQHRKHRSLDASARAWVLIDKIAERTGEKKIDVYRNAIKDIGGVSATICVIEKAAETLCQNWETHGQGWMTEISPSKIDGCKNVTLWYGSSVYDTKQMSDLISSLVQDANALGIPTMSPKEEAEIIQQWGRKHGG